MSELDPKIRHKIISLFDDFMGEVCNIRDIDFDNQEQVIEVTRYLGNFDIQEAFEDAVVEYNE